MKMRWPLAVLLCGAKGADERSALNRLAHREPAESLAAEVAVERIERRVVIRLVSQDHNRAVVLRLRIISHGVHAAAQRRVHRCAWWREEIDTKVNGAAFEEWGRVDEA